MVAICQGNSSGKFTTDFMSKGITAFQLHVSQADQHFRDNWTAVIFHSSHSFLRGRIVSKSSPANALAGLEGKWEGNNDKGLYRLILFLRLIFVKCNQDTEK